MDRSQKYPSPKIILTDGFRDRANVLLAISNYAVMKRPFHPRDHDGDQSAFFLCLPKLHITLASPPSAAFTKLARYCFSRLHWAFHWRGWVSIGASLFGDAESGFGDNKGNIDQFFEQHPKLGHIALYRAVNKSLTTQNAVNRLACIINHRNNPRIIHMARAKNANRSDDRPVIISVRRNHQ